MGTICVPGSTLCPTLQCNELDQGHPTFFCQSQDKLRTKESEFVHFRPNTNEVKSDWDGIDGKGSMKVDCDTSIYGKMLFIFITEKANKYILNGGPNVGLEC